MFSLIVATHIWVVSCYEFQMVPRFTFLACRINLQTTSVGLFSFASKQTKKLLPSTYREYVAQQLFENEFISVFIVSFAKKVVRTKLTGFMLHTCIGCWVVDRIRVPPSSH